MRSVIASLDQRYREQVHEVETVPLIVREPPEACAVCGGRMNVQKTIQRWGKTLAHGLFRVRETIYACASRRKKGHRVVTARSSFLAQLLLCPLRSAAIMTLESRIIPTLAGSTACGS